MNELIDKFKNNKDFPNKFDCFGFVLGYDYRVHKWVYDVKYYLNDNNWCLDPEGKMIFRQVTERELKSIERHQNIIDEHERKNVAWIKHKQCKKRSCICKKCEKYCYCYNCVDKIISCKKISN